MEAQVASRVPEGIEPSGDLDRIPAEVILNPGKEYGDDFRRFQGIPGIAYTGDRLWATWYGGGVTENKYNYVMLASSDDRGASWSEVRLVVDPDRQGPVADFDPDEWRRNRWADSPRLSGEVRAYDPVIWTDPDGRLWLFWAQNGGAYRSTVATWAIHTEQPNVENPEWSEPVYISDGVMMNKPTVLSSGEWLFPMAFWNQETSCWVLRTTDKGLTWEFIGGASIPDPEDRSADEHMIVERNDGALWMWVRTMYGIGESFSSDKGHTWSPVRRSPVEHAVARFFVRKLPSGNLLLVKHGPLNEQTGRTLLSAYVSTNDGETWSDGFLIDERGVSYPDGAITEDGTIYIIYDYSRRREKAIYVSSFSEAEVLAGGEARAPVLVNQAKGVNLHTYDIKKNSDGKAFQREPRADLKPSEGEVAILERGTLLFTDRKHELLHVAPELVGYRFIRGSIRGTRMEALSAGMITVLTPAPEVNANGSLSESLLERGFLKVNLSDSALFYGKSNISTAYQKKVEAGEVLEFGSWGIIVF